MKKIWQYIIKNPVVTIFVCCLLLCAAMFLATARMRAYNSDDVIWQNALLYWQPFHNQLYYSDAGATYLAKLPIYWLISLFLSPGRRALMAGGLIFTLVNFTVIYFSTVYLLHRAKLRVSWSTLAPFLWLASFGYGVASLFAAPNLHNVEVSSIFFTFAILVKIYSDRISFTRSSGTFAWAFALVLFMGLMISNDHYYLFIFTLPAIAFVIITSFLKLPIKRQNLQVFILLVASFVVSKIIDFVATKAGIILIPGLLGESTPELVKFDTLLTSIITSLHSVLTIFGADFWGRPISGVLTYVNLLNAILLVALISYGFILSRKLIIRLRTNKKVSIETIIPTLLFTVMLSSFLLLAITTTSQQSSDPYHYLVVIPFFAIPLLCWLFATQKVSQWLYVVLVLAVLLNTGSALVGIKKPRLINEPYNIATPLLNDQTHNLRLIEYLKANGLAKGFGGYADSNINTYLSKGSVDIIPTNCATNVPRIARLLFAENQVDKHANKTFYLYNPSAFPFPSSCTPDQAETVLGKPTETLHNQDNTILVYPYDITSKL